MPPKGKGKEGDGLMEVGGMRISQRQPLRYVCTCNTVPADRAVVVNAPGGFTKSIVRGGC